MADNRTCEKCLKTFRDPSSLRRHQARKNPCDMAASIEDIPYMRDVLVHEIAKVIADIVRSVQNDTDWFNYCRLFYGRYDGIADAFADRGVLYKLERLFSIINMDRSCTKEIDWFSILNQVLVENKKKVVDIAWQFLSARPPSITTYLDGTDTEDEEKEKHAKPTELGRNH